MNKKELKHLIKESMIQMGIVGLRPINLREDEENDNIISPKKPSSLKGATIKEIYFETRTKEWHIITNKGEMTINNLGMLEIY
ncbi:MAG: hypothetical protein M0R17_10335 [Candidatus Omnitrophica bacterium]|jgi:hypothetical protein|nr:hypothetical protein [Candidatus Omnitrophota bacterium]